MDDTINLLQVTPFQSHKLYVTFSKHVKWRLSCTIMTIRFKRKHGGGTSMAQAAYKSRTPSLILGFRGVKLSSKFGDSYFFLDFETSYIPLVNGFLI